MRNTLKALFVASFTVLAFLAINQQAAAQPGPPGDGEPPDTGLTPVTIGAPTISTELCGSNNDQFVLGSVNPSEGAYLSGDTNWSDNERTFTYTASDDYKISGDSVFKIYDQGEYCQPTPVTPKPPQRQRICGVDNNDIVTLPEQRPGVLVVTNGPWVDGTWTVVFEPDDGYYFPDEVYSYSYQEENERCDVTIVAPAISAEICGVNNDQFIMGSINPDNGARLISDTSWFENTRTFTFTANVGFEISGDSVFTLTDANDTCITPLAPSIFAENCGANNDQVSIPYQPELTIHTTDEWNENSFTVSFTPTQGYAFPPETQTSFTFTDANDTCVTPIAPSITARICGPNNDTVHIPDQPDGVEIVANGPWTPNGYLVEFSPADGYAFPSETSAHRFYDTLTACVVPALPTIDTEICGPNNDIVTVPNQRKGIEVITDGPWTDGSYTVTFEATGNYDFPPDTQTSFTFTDKNDTCVSAIAPTIVEVCGPNNDVVSIPDQPEGVIITASDTWEDGRFSMGFEAAEGYGFPAGSPTGMVAIDQATPCPEGVLVPPVQVDVCGPNNDDVVIPDQPEGIEVESDGPWTDGSYTVIFEVTGNYDFPPDTQTSFTLTEKSTPCVVAISPTIVEACGPNNDVVSIPDQPEGVIVTTSDAWEDGRFSVEFKATEGYGFQAGSPTGMVAIDQATPCPEGVPVPPVQVDVCGPNNDDVVIPDQPEGIEVESDGSWADGAWNVTFSATEGFVLPESTQAVYDLADTATECPAPVQQVTINVEMPDDTSAEGGLWQLFVPMASQAAVQPYAEGVVGANNTFLLPELVPGMYRLTVDVNGYVPLDTVIEITLSSTELTVQIAAIQNESTPVIIETPTQTSTPASTPTQPPTSTPDTIQTQTPEPSATAPAAEAGPVTSLPATGTGSGSSLLLIGSGIAASLFALTWLGVVRHQGRC